MLLYMQKVVTSDTVNIHAVYKMQRVCKLSPAIHFDLQMGGA